ncbi:MAG: hypothetical protein AB7K09_00155 [Planctomycetota bacterium]
MAGKLKTVPEELYARAAAAVDATYRPHCRGASGRTLETRCSSGQSVAPPDRIHDCPDRA